MTGAWGWKGPHSPRVVRMVGTAAARVSFAESSELLAELAGLRIDPKRVERAAEALGGEIAEDECLRVESGLPSAPTMVLGMDGTGVPVAGKQPDGSAKTREVKLVTALDGGIPRPARPAEARPGLGQLLGGDRKCRHPRHRSRPVGVRPAGRP